jgi:hypothetical protein
MKKETIYLNNETYLSFSDRCRVLFGKSIHLDITIDIGEDYQPIKTTTKTWVERFMFKKQYGQISKVTEESNWINVIDKMPERHLEFHRSILVTCKTDSHEIMEDAFTDNNNDFYGNDGFLINNVTHWKYRNN